MGKSYTAGMELALKPETEGLIKRALDSGRFANADALISTAMGVLLDSTPADLENLDTMIQEGIDSADSEKLYSEAEARAYIASVRAKL